MIILESDYFINEYGIQGRFVQESDAEFILKLRTNPLLNKYLHKTENNLAKQKEWIRKYKIREREGRDYYFIYSINNIPFSVIRIYDIEEERATIGSWICEPGHLVEEVLATILITRNILFNVLNKKHDYFSVDLENKSVLKMHKMMGATIYGQNEKEYHLVLDKNTYLIKRNELLELFDLN